MKSLAKLFGFVSVAILAATISSCSNFMSDSQSSQSKSGAYITFSSDDMARTVLPDTQSTVLKDFVLKGLKDGESEPKTLGSWATKSAFQNAVVPVDLGEWTFTLSAYGDGTKFEGSVQKTIVLGENRLLFELEISDGGIGKGSFGITLSFDEATNASSIAYAIAVFETIDGESVAGVEPQTLTPANKAVTFAASNIPAGTYRARVRFYSQGFEVGSYREIVQVASGLCSAATRTIESFDDLYTITYVLGGGSFAAGSTAQETFSRKSVVALPAENEIVRDNYKFLGWYTDESFSNESKIEKIENTAKNMTLYARYAKRYATVGGLECWSCDEAVEAILAATGDITVTLYSDVTAEEIGKSGYTVDEVDGTLSATAVESNTIASAIARTSADSVALIVDPPAGIKLNADSSFIFAGCSKLVSADLRGLDTSSATIIAAMFAHCDNLATLNVSGFDTSNVTDMRAMFYNCKKVAALDVSAFDTSKVTDMRAMFYGCESLRALDVTGFNTSKVTNMGAMFYKCEGLKVLDVSGFDTSNVVWMQSMFACCKNILTVDVSGFDTAKVESMKWMFSSCVKLEIIYSGQKFVTSSVTDSERMFYGCGKLVGQAGTKYNSQNLDATYARIDGGSSAPGYFYNNEIKVYADKDGKGIRFQINKPKSWGNKEINWICIYCRDPSGQTTLRVYPKLDANADRIECLYPLCSAGESCKFGVQFEHLEDNVLLDEIFKEFKLTAIGGDGGIDFSSVEHTCVAKYNNDGKVEVDITCNGCPSSLTVEKTGVVMFATDKGSDWGTDKIQYFHSVESDGKQSKVTVEDMEEFNSQFLRRSDNGVRTKFFVETYFTLGFDHNSFENIDKVELNRVGSNTVDIRMPVSMEVTVNESDISVKKIQNGSNVIFGAEKCDTYSWTLDDKVIGTEQSCVIDTATLVPGTYSLALEVTKGTKHYSYYAQLKCAYDAGGQSSTVSQFPGDDFDEQLFTTDRLQTSHVKVENVAGGLKFTITRPDDDVFNPNYLIGIDENSYESVGGGNGNYIRDGYEYVGDGNGNYILDGDQYRWVYEGMGDYKEKYTLVGDGKGNWKKGKKIFGGINWVGIARCEYINGELNDWTTAASLPAWEWSGSQNTFTCIYPLCEPAERYVFLVTIQPTNPRDHREYQKDEYLSVIALEGVGDIDYSHLDGTAKLDLQFDGTKPVATISNYEKPENLTVFDKDFYSVVEYEAGIKGNETNASYGIGNVEEKGFVNSFDKDYWSGRFKALVKAKGKDSFYARYYLKFKVPGSEGINEFRTITVDSSSVVQIEP